MKNLIVSLAFLCVWCSGCSQAEKKSPSKSYALVIESVSYFDSETDNWISPAWVYIDSGRIAKISEEALEVPVTETIDGAGKYLIPGLTEMHAHIPTPNQRGREYVDETLFLYLSQGVTTIRGMLGAPFHLELIKEVTNGQTLSPRIYTSGPSLNGNTVNSVEEADEKVRAYKESGYDFLKLHPGLTRENFDQIVKTANEVGIPFAGHVAIDVGVRHALESKYATIDHMDGYVEGLVQDDSIDPASNGFFGINFTHLADTALIDDLVNLTLKNHVAIVPTQCLLERWAGPDDPQTIGSQPEMKYIPADMLERWVSSVVQFQEAEGYEKEKAADFIQLRQHVLNRLYTEGATLLLGSDAPQIFNVPGFSIHREIQSMANFGMTPADIIKSGTTEVAKFFNATEEFGDIREGLSADLVLLNSDPLKDVGNMDDIGGVMVRGTWLSEDDISKRLQDIETQYQQR